MAATRHHPVVLIMLKVSTFCAALVLLAGCAGFGGGSGGKSGKGSEYGLVAGGEFGFALSGQLKPFSFYENGKLTGFDVAIGNEVARRLGLKPKPATGAFNTLLAGLTSGRFDAIVGSMTKTDERSKVADFTQNYYVSGAYLWVKQDSAAQSVKDLKNASVGMALGTTFEGWAKKQPNIKQVRTYESDLDALADVPTGRIDGSITDELVGGYAVKNAGLKVRKIGESLLDNSAAIPVRKKHEKLRAAIDKALADMKTDGTYSKISMRWFGVDLGK